MNLSVGQPWLLWALLVCPVIALATWRTRIEATRLRLAFATVTRMLAAALLAGLLA